MEGIKDYMDLYPETKAERARKCPHCARISQGLNAQKYKNRKLQLEITRLQGLLKQIAEHENRNLDNIIQDARIKNNVRLVWYHSGRQQAHRDCAAIARKGLPDYNKKGGEKDANRH